MESVKGIFQEKEREGKKKMWHRIRKQIALIDDAGGAVVGVAIVSLLFMVGANTILRYIFASSWPFVEEYSGYALVMMTFVALGYTLKENGHISIDFIVNHSPQRVRANLAVATTAVSLLVIGVLFWYALALAINSLQHDVRSHSLMATPLWIPQMFIVVGLFIFGLELIAYLVKKISELKS